MSIKIKFNLKAFEDIRRSEPVREEIEKHIDNIYVQLPDGYGEAVEQGHSRLRGAIWTEDYDAIVDNATNHTLLQLLSREAGR